MQQIIKDISNFFSTIWSSLWSFFQNSPTIIIRGIIIYLLIVILIRWRLYYSRKIFHSANTLFRVSMDDLYYQTSLILYKNKWSIYDFQSNIPLLLQYKTQEINKRSKATYYNNYEKLLEEIEYIAQLTNTSLSYNRTELDKQYHTVRSLDHTMNSIYNIFMILTLWIGKLLV